MRFFSIPLGHKLTAVLVAGAAVYGIHIWLERRAVETASTAELSFSLHAARRLDAGFVHAGDPAVVFAQSVLSDRKIADLSKPAFLSTAGVMSRIGEFRSRLNLTQISPEELGVRFKDADSAKAVQTANAIADALVAWSPAPDAPAAVTEPASGASTQPAAQQSPTVKTAPARTPAPAKKPTTAKNNPETNTSNASGTSSPLAGALEQLQQQLSSTSRQVAEGASEGHTRPGYEGRAYAESEQQHLIKAQVHDAEKKVRDLRSQYGSGRDGQRLGAIQQALASVFAGGSVGVSASQLRRERDGLTRAIAVVETQRAAVEKEGGTGAESGAAAATQTPAGGSNAAPSPAASTSDSGSISESDLGKSGSPAPAPQNSQPLAPAASQADSGSSAASAPIEDPSLANPFRIERAAGVAVPVPWWQAAVAGAGCGLLYWILMAMISGRRDEDAAYAEDNVSYGRFITSDGPVTHVTPEPEPAPVPAAAERDSYRRASFTWDPGPAGNAARVESEAVPVQGEAGPVQSETTPVESGAAPIQSETVPVEAGSAVEGSLTQGGEQQAANESAAGPVAREAFHQEKAEKVVEMDPWADLVQKALSETDIGRKFESPAEQREAAAEGDAAQRSVRRDRMAG